MKILITGSNGFIGRHLVDALSRGAKHQACCPSSSELNILSKESFNNYLDEEIEVVVHLAAKSYVPKSWEEPDGFLETNVLGTSRVLEFCRETGAKLVLLSSYLYGEPNYLPINEEHPLKTPNPYALSKKQAEELCTFYRENMGVKVCVLRPFNVYGPGQSPEFLIPSILNQAIENGKVSVMDLVPKRDYVYVRDVVRAIVLAVETNTEGTFNISSGSSLSVQEVIETVGQCLEKNLKVFSKENIRKNEISNVVGDASRAQKELFWFPKYSFYDGIAEMIKALGVVSNE